MATDTRTAKLVINDLTKEQFETITNPSDTELYLVPDDTDDKLALKQDKTDNDLATVSKTVVGAINELDTKVEEIEAARFPNAIIIGEPTISQGQVSNFTTANYLQFPFVVDLTNRKFTAEFCFTTGDDVTTQQNILDSQFGLALAIANGKGLMAISHNGTSWAGSVTGTKTIEPNTTYYAKLSWNRINYQTQLSTDGTTYTPDMNFGSIQSPYPRTMFIGGCSGSVIGHTAHPFKGTINLNKCRLYIEDVEVWQGMDDVGLATRADVSLDNLDALGKEKIQDTRAVFRGNYDSWTAVPETATYSADVLGDTKPHNGNFIVVTDSSDYTISEAIPCRITITAETTSAFIRTEVTRDEHTTGDESTVEDLPKSSWAIGGYISDMERAFRIEFEPDTTGGGTYRIDIKSETNSLYLGGTKYDKGDLITSIHAGGAETVRYDQTLEYREVEQTLEGKWAFQYNGDWETNGKTGWEPVFEMGSGSGKAEWGFIAGTLANQTDLQNALNAKQNTVTYDATTKTLKF